MPSRLFEPTTLAVATARRVWARPRPAEGAVGPARCTGVGTAGLVVPLLLFVVIGCTGARRHAGDGAAPAAGAPDPARLTGAADDRVVAPRTPERTIPLTLYFGNPAYAATGDEALPHLLAEPRAVPRTPRIAAAALRELLEVGPLTSGGIAVAPAGVTAEVVRIADGIAVVDFSRAGLAGGSLQEATLIGAVVWTLTELPTVTAVSFTVAGAPVETLMGHADVTRPLRREDLSR